jgi:hypothetical protein
VGFFVAPGGLAAGSLQATFDKNLGAGPSTLGWPTRQRALTQF